MPRLLSAAFVLILAGQAPSASARNTILDLPVDAAMASPRASALRDVPVFMEGQDHPATGESLGTFNSNRRTNAFGKSDEDACIVAFLSAIIALQDRAKALGGTAVIDIKSITQHNDLSSATQYRCAAGGIIANVALTGTVVAAPK
jgi:hypothetical protein